MGGVGIQIGGEDGALLGVVDLAGLMARHENIHAPFDHLIDFAGREVDGGDAVGIGDHQFLAVGRVRILVEVERRGSVFARKTNDAMAGVGIDPFGGQRGLRGQQPQPD